MPSIEYCDNTNCQLNNKFECSAEEILLDDHAVCISAKYAGEAKAPGTNTPPASSSPGKNLSIEENDNWIKYI